MKKIASLFLILIATISCTQDITRNNPALQGLKDEVLWRAKDSQAVLESNGSLTITGLTQYETLVLTTAASAPANYGLGVNNANRVSYNFSKDDIDLNYATGPGMGDGEIVITEFDESNMTVTGTFRFNAENVDGNPAGGEVLNFREGHFYKVPVIPAL